MSWRVTYDFANPLQVASPLAGYPSLGVEFKYDAAGDLIGLSHYVEIGGGSPADAVRVSERDARVLFEAIEFLYGLPAKIARQRAENLDSDSAGIAGFASAEGGMALALPIAFPSETAILRAPTRLVVRLHLFNLARASATDAVAVYLYYLIWEDMHGRPGESDGGTPQDRLKFARDFVSHGEALRNRAAVAFIESQTTGSIVAFDPTREDHASLVARQRQEARTLIEAELRNTL